jgi:nucleobase:cation symporter-1, NCS1 family
MAIMGKTSGAAVRIYQITYIVGFFLGCILHLTVNKLFPPSGLGIAEPFDDRETSEGTVIEGVASGTDSGSTTPKQAVATESKALPEVAA